jgi:S-adenosylmethionine hydrolase
VAKKRRGSNVVSILTDFGTADGYVAAMKGVILGINRKARIVDVTHEVRPQDVWGGAFVLHSVCRYFPPGSVHLAVVDPDVGTDRAGVILDTGEALFVAPDNGLLSFLLEGARDTEPRRHEDAEGPGVDVGRGALPRRSADAGNAAGNGEGLDRSEDENAGRESRLSPLGHRALPCDTGEGEGTRPSTHHPSPITHHSLPPGWRAVRIEEPRYWLPEPSNTFHGRDIFAPVAAHLSLGEPPDSFGPAMDKLVTLPIPRPMRRPDGRVCGAVLHVDRFGNLITNLRGADLPPEPFQIETGAQRISGLIRTYAEGRGLIALIGSSGYLEIARSGGSAHAEVGVGVGAEVWALPIEQVRS